MESRIAPVPLVPLIEQLAIGFVPILPGPTRRTDGNTSASFPRLTDGEPDAAEGTLGQSAVFGGMVGGTGRLRQGSGGKE